VVIAWFYDITPDGFRRTSQIIQTTGDKEEHVPEPAVWKAATFISLMVVVGLVLYNILGGSLEVRAGDIQSLVILPFENFTGDDQLENMVSGMHSMLIGDMGRVSNLRVIGKTSSNLYKDANMSARDIAGELNVDAVVEATVMCLGDSVCMQFRLVSTDKEERQLWVGEYHEEKGQMLNLYNRVTKQIAHEVQIKLTDSEEQTLNRDRGADRDALDAYIRSYAYWGDLSADSLDKAKEDLMQALEKDPQWAPIHAALAVVWAARMQMGQVDPKTGREMTNQYIERARELDEDFADSHFINAVLYTWTDWEWEKGEREFLDALALNPNHVMARIYYAHLLMILQRMDEALEQGKLAVALDPKNPLILSLYSTVLKGAKRDEEVLDYVEKALAIDPGHKFSLGQLGRALYGSGEYERNLELQMDLLSGRLPED
jgi:adenylate cyclase